MVIFDDSMKLQSVKSFYKDLMDEIKDLPENTDERVDVYFSTTGGIKYLVPVFYGIINKYYDSINIILTTEMCSAGFDLLYMLRDKELFVGPEFTYSMTHKGSLTIDIQNEVVLNLATNHTERGIKDWVKRYKKLGFTKQELKDFSAGMDLYFDKKRTMELFPNLKELNCYE